MAKILICDDAAFMRMTIRETLEKDGHEIVAEAEGVEEALQAYKKHLPDLVTMDIIMKDSGVEAIRKILSQNPHAKILLLTVLNRQEKDVIEGIRAGALGLVTKPIKREVLISEVKRVLAIEK